MEFSCAVTLLALLVSTLANVKSEKAVGLGSFILTKLEMCDPSVDYALKMEGEIKNADNKQFLTSKSVFKVNLGENSDFNVTISMKKTKEDTEFSPMLSVYEDDTCAGMKKYLGAFVEEMEKAAGLEPGKCPIEKGTYSITDFPLNFKSISYQSIPEGILRAVQVVSNKQTKEVLWCVIAEGENFRKSS